MNRDRRRLLVASAICALGYVLHNVDHARRGLAGTPDAVVWAGTLLLLLAAVVFTLVTTDHPGAPLLAAGLGFGTAIGVSAAHLLPDWGALSDPLVDRSASAVTWIAVLAEIAGGLVLGVVATQIVLRAERPETSATARAV